MGGKKLEMVCNVAAEMMMMNMMILIMLEQNKNNTSRKVQITKGTGTKICIQYFFLLSMAVAMKNDAILFHLIHQDSSL